MKWKMEEPIIFFLPFSTRKFRGRIMYYIADAIGSDYEKWVAGDTVFISAPTGSGKTTFILNIFLPYLARKKIKILYLVNRKVLKEQIEAEVRKLPIELREKIKIELYQSIENRMSSLRQYNYLPEYYKGYYNAVEDKLSVEDKNALRNQLNKYQKKNYSVNGYNNMQGYAEYGCVVCDEAHYFLMDSNYNTNTILSYNFVRRFFGNKLRIYMSATLEGIKNFVIKDNSENRYLRTEWFGVHADKVKGVNCLPYHEYEYTAKRNYDYIDVKVLRHRDDISDIVCNGNKKWLIFVDSKEFGMILKQDIKKKISAKDKASNKEIVAFITSDYASDQESAFQVEEIVSNSKQSVKVLIATSVLDNGINLKDLELRNIIVIADTETEFIQMLGRKRRDGKQLQLYIYKQSKDHFIRRHRINSKREKIAEHNYLTIRKYIQQAFDRNRNIYEINQLEFEWICDQHKFLMQKAMNNVEYFENLSASFLALDGILFLNLLSFYNIENLQQFYDDLISEFEEYGENAFLRKQLQWLNKTEEEIEEILIEDSLNEIDKSRKNVKGALKRIAGQGLNKVDFIKFKNEIRTDLMVLVDSVGKEHPDYKKHCDAINKNDRGISKNLMRFLRENCEIPFVLEVENSIHTVREEED